MFALDQQLAVLSNVNPRDELNGQDHILACDLKFSIKASNNLLNKFHPRLKSSFYWLNTSIAADELFATPDNLPNLIFPALGPFTWKNEFAGYTLYLSHGIGAHICIEQCEVNNFKFEMQEGGAVLISMCVQCHPSSEQIANLCKFISQKVDISLTPPDAPADLMAE